MMAIGDGAYLFSLPLRKLFTNCKRTHSSCSRPQKAHSSLSLSSVAGRHCGRRPNLNQTLPPAAPDVLYYKRYISAVNISLTKPWVLAPRHYDRNLAIIVIPWPRDMYHNNAQTPRVHNRVHVYLLLVPVRIYNFYLSSIQRFCNCFRTALLHPPRLLKRRPWWWLETGANGQRLLFVFVCWISIATRPISALRPVSGLVFPTPTTYNYSLVGLVLKSTTIT